MFHIFPDGTSLLVDAGDSMRFYGTPKETPHLPDLSRRSGEWVARYVERVNPKGCNVNFFHLSHYHEDHGGGERYHGDRMRVSTGEYWLCGLADVARFLSFEKVIDRAWPTFDDPLDVLQTSRDGTPRNIKAVYADLADRGTRVERFRLGARNQFQQLNVAEARAGFEVFNVCANGRYVRRDGSIRDIYAPLVAAGAKELNENGLSCGFVVSYGKFRYFTAGDFSDSLGDEGAETMTEDLLAEALEPVDVAKINHHGHHSMTPRLVSALRARVWTACVFDQAHCTSDTMARLTDRSLYGGPRICIPTYMPLRGRMKDEYSAYLKDVAMEVVAEPCHVVLDVPEGGETYSISCWSATSERPEFRGQYEFVSNGIGDSGNET